MIFSLSLVLTNFIASGGNIFMLIPIIPKTIGT